MVFRRLLRSPYFWITLLALLWMGWLDTYNWIEQYRLSQRIRAMREQLAFYEREITLLRQEEEALRTDPYTQQRYARQHYWVKHPEEVLYILPDSTPSFPLP
ncbi:MAG: hypothetical protein NZ580_05785 [Bacteroidia bacterium]|nr:hypothetical protein [Bacteroidia bacterium]MDW8236301.1 hypothetical protein [Bacteroidia bacterium]